MFNYDNFFRGDIGVPRRGWFPSRFAGEQRHAGGQRLPEPRAKRRLGLGAAQHRLQPCESGRRQPERRHQRPDREDRGCLRHAALRQQGKRPGAWDGNIGVRVVKTEDEAIGLLRVNAPQNVMTPAACVAANGAAACAAADQRAARSRPAAISPASSSRTSYTDVLPSFNLRLFLRDDLQLRFAAAQGHRAADVQPDDAVHLAELHVRGRRLHAGRRGPGHRHRRQSAARSRRMLEPVRHQPRVVLRAHG